MVFLFCRQFETLGEVTGEVKPEVWVLILSCVLTVLSVSSLCAKQA